MASKITEFISTVNSDEKKTVNVEINTKLISEFIARHKEIGKIVKVITMIGVSRSGKSAFLNCLTTYITGQKSNLAPFKSLSFANSHGKDVTIGANGYVLAIPKEDATYLIIDIQGIAGQFSAADPLVLLFCYYISDLFILSVDKCLTHNRLIY
jgi:hypothetical protein